MVIRLHYCRPYTFTRRGFNYLSHIREENVMTCTSEYLYVYLNYSVFIVPRMEIKSEYPDVFIPDKITIGQLLLGRCQLHGDAVALVSTLKTESRQGADFGVTGSTGGYHHDERQCCQWRQSWHLNFITTTIMPTVTTKLALWLSVFNEIQVRWVFTWCYW